MSTPTNVDRDELAHEIAEESEKSLLECMLLTARDADGSPWLDLGSAISTDAELGTSFYIDRAVRYLEGEGILKRHPENSQLIGWDDMDI